MHQRVFRFAVLIFLGGVSVAAAQWEPAQGPLMTRWAEDVSPDSVHAEYPRPQMVREEWANLNGLWEYAIAPRHEGRPGEFDGEILVPFPVESALSGVMKRVGPQNRLWYRRTFEVPDSWSSWSGEQVLLHFGAVDWETEVWVNGRKVGDHRGGYDPFSFDITNALSESGEQEIVVAVWDPSDAGYQPRGKQVRNPHSIWYTPVTGMWQTVWIEPVKASHIRSLKIVPNVDEGAVSIGFDAQAAGAGATTVQVEVLDEGERVARGHVTVEPGEDAEGSATTTIRPRISLAMEDAKLWSPDSPFLYDLKVTLLQDGQVVDEIGSYFGMRKIALGKDENGITRLFLNNEPLFQYGPLDQGYWPDGLYTAPTDEALRYDLEVTKKLGFNMVRKHVKVEPARWYYWTDKLGLLVWQDMPSGDRYIGRDDADIERTAQSARQFEVEMTRMIDAFHNHPSIVMWVPFNEGWGQYDTARITRLVKEYDPTRLVDNPSGWTDRGVGDVHDIHAYPGPASPMPEEDRAAVLGEFGGLGLPISGHTWQDEENWGYRSYETPEELTEAYLKLLRELRVLIGEPGLAAAVYTQTTDVEIEVNGLMTYDRAVLKMPAEVVAEANHKLYLPPPIVRTVAPTSRESGVSWRYTTEEPSGGWQEPDFDASAWEEGVGGFGQEDTPGARTRTQWTGSDIWLRRTFELPADLEMQNPHLAIHHDEDAEVYINGRRAAKLTGYTGDYVMIPLSDAARGALRPGENTLAVHCRQTEGGQYIDVGVVDLVERDED